MDHQQLKDCSCFECYYEFMIDQEWILKDIKREKVPLKNWNSLLIPLLSILIVLFI